jgi:hypothetical protein
MAAVQIFCSFSLMLCFIYIMTMDERPRKKSTSSGRKAQGRVIPALVFDDPQLTTFLLIRNIIDSTLECVDHIVAQTGDTVGYAMQVLKCIEHLDECVRKNRETVSEDLRRKIHGFMEVAGAIGNIYVKENHGTLTEDELSRQRTDLFARQQHLRWFDICIRQEIPFIRDNNA